MEHNRRAIVRKGRNVENKINGCKWSARVEQEIINICVMSCPRPAKPCKTGDCKHFREERKKIIDKERIRLEKRRKLKFHGGG